MNVFITFLALLLKPQTIIPDIDFRGDAQELMQ